MAAIAYDSPLVIVVGGQLLADRAIPLNLLECNEDFRRKVLNRFQDILVGQISEQINPEICKKILELIAAVSPIQLANEQFQQAVTEFIGIDKATLIRSLGTLEQAGVLLRRGNNLRITPDVLADHILHKACLTEQGDSTGYAQETFEAFRSKLNISYASLKLLDEWVNSDNAEKIRSASILTGEFHAGFIFGQLEFVSNLLEQAYKAGDECYKVVSSNLFRRATSGVKMGIPGQPFPEDVRLRDQACAIAKQFFKGSPVRKFFDSLVKYAESDIAFQQIFYEERWE